MATSSRQKLSKYNVSKDNENLICKRQRLIGNLIGSGSKNLPKFDLDTDYFELFFALNADFQYRSMISTFVFDIYTSFKVKFI